VGRRVDWKGVRRDYSGKTLEESNREQVLSAGGKRAAEGERAPRLETCPLSTISRRASCLKCGQTPADEWGAADFKKYPVQIRV